MKTILLLASALLVAQSAFASTYHCAVEMSEKIQPGKILATAEITTEFGDHHASYFSKHFADFYKESRASVLTLEIGQSAMIDRQMAIVTVGRSLKGRVSDQLQRVEMTGIGETEFSVENYVFALRCELR